MRSMKSNLNVQTEVGPRGARADMEENSRAQGASLCPELVPWRSRDSSRPLSSSLVQLLSLVDTL